MKYIAILLVIVAFSCKTVTTPAMEAKAEEISNFIAAKNFEFQATTVNPLSTNELNQLANSGLLPPGDSTNRINLQGRGDFMRITGNTVTASLSYYGTRHFATLNNRDNGIELEGPIENYNVTEDENGRKEISFDASNDTENFTINITAYPGGKANIYISSTKRNSISYDGVIKEFNPEEFKK